MRRITLSATTDTGGDANVTSSETVTGYIYAILYLPGTLATGADLTITGVGTVYTTALLTKGNAGTSDSLYYPRTAVHAVANGAALTVSAGGDAIPPYVINAKINLVVAQGGNTLTGKIVVYVDDK